MDVDGLGTRTIALLVERGLINNLSALLYRLDAATLASLEGMGKRSAEKLVAALEQSRQQPWHRLLFALVLATSAGQRQGPSGGVSLGCSPIPGRTA